MQSRAVLIGEKPTPVSCSLSDLTATLTSKDVEWFDERNQEATGKALK